MEKAAQNILHLIPFKKVSREIFNTEKKKKATRQKKRYISNVLGRKIVVLSHFNSKHSLIYEMSAFCLLFTFVIFSLFYVFQDM